MKIKVVLITENDKPVNPACSKEFVEEQAKLAWQLIMDEICALGKECDLTDDRAIVESCELMED